MGRPWHGYVAEVAVTWLTAFLDTPAEDAPANEAYWAAVTGWPLSERRGEFGEFATLQPPEGDSPVRVQVVGSPPPGGMHLDVHADDVEATSEAVAHLGASVTPTGRGYAVCRSPGGLVFCVVPHRAAQRPPPTPWPGGASLVDQVCLDIPSDRFEAEAEFWVAVLGWPRQRGVSREFDRLMRPPGQPLRILLQRLDQPDGPVRLHLDLASEHRDVEVSRHVGLGGRVVRETPWWTTLLDPSGRAYCVTDRDPATGVLP
jgi:hypothetical protein